jgi:hypothetical protein
VASVVCIWPLGLTPIECASASSSGSSAATAEPCVTPSPPINGALGSHPGARREKYSTTLSAEAAVGAAKPAKKVIHPPMNPHGRP